MKNFFLDQSIIVGYASFIFNEPEAIIKAIERFGKICVDFIESNKKEQFITCFYIIENDLPKFKNRRKIVLQEIRKKIQNPNYEIGSSELAKKYLYKRDINWAKRIFSLLRILTPKQLFNLLIKIDAVFSIRIEYLIKNVIDKIVVPIEEINKELVNILREFIDDYSDCNILASVLQYTTDQSKSILKTKIERKIIFITLDKEHFNENNIAFIKEDQRLKNHKFPEVRVLI